MGQTLSLNGKREVGFAMGYSLINGDSVPAKRAELTGNAAMIWRTRKSYPFALDRKIGRVPAGRDFYCVCYRNYFDPPRFKTPTCVYWHKEGDDAVVYVDYHQSVQHDRVKLPETLTGRKFTVVEKTPALTLNTTRTVPEEGLDITVDQYGYVVLRIGSPLKPGRN